MAIAFDAALQTQVNSSVTSVTRSFAISGSDRFIATNGLTTSSGDMTGVTYAGNAMTKAGETNVDSFSCETYFGLAPTTGTNDVVFSNGSSATFVTVAASWTGVKQSFTPTVDATASGTGTVESGSLTTVSANSWIVTSSRNGGSQPEQTGNENYERRASNSSNGVHIGDSNAALAAQSNDVSFDTPVSNTWGLLLMEIEDVAAAPAGPATLKTADTVAVANVKTMNGVAIANIKTINTAA